MALNAPSGRTFLLMGSGEFEPWSNEIEAAALDGRPGPVAVLPTASSAEGDDVFGRWGRMGLEHYAAAGIDGRLVPVGLKKKPTPVPPLEPEIVAIAADHLG